jgi:hypothetical protein
MIWTNAPQLVRDLGIDRPIGYLGNPRRCWGLGGRGGASVVIAYPGRTNFNGFESDGAGAYSRFDRLIRIATAGGRTIRIVWIVNTLLALSTMRSQAANFLS